MIIKNINTCGLDRVYEGYQVSVINGMESFSSGLVEFLNYSMISIELDNLTTIELFYLKKFCSYVKLIDTRYSNFVPNNESNEKIYNNVESLLLLHDEMLKDEDIDKEKSEIDNVLPIGCTSHHVIAVFKGGSILSITGVLIADIFKDDDKALFKTYPGDNYMKNKISDLFINSFYKFIVNEYSRNLDLMAEFMTNKKFYQYSESICDLSHVNTPHGELVLFASDNNKLQKQLNDIKESCVQTPYYLEDCTYLTFVLNTTFKTFMKFIMETSYVNSHQLFNIVSATSNLNVGDDIFDKYEARLKSSIDAIMEHRALLRESTTIDLNECNYILNGNTIKFAVVLSLSDILKFADTLSGNYELELIKTSMTNSYNIINNLIK